MVERGAGKPFRRLGSVCNKGAGAMARELAAMRVSLCPRGSTGGRLLRRLTLNELVLKLALCGGLGRDSGGLDCASAAGDASAGYNCLGRRGNRILSGGESPD